MRNAMQSNRASSPFEGEGSVFRRPPLSAHDIDRALASAARWLLDRQAPDGAWRSETYGVFKEGDALTPLAVNTLLDCDEEAVIGAARLGADYLAAMAPADGSTVPGPHGLAYPVYTAALAVRALCRLGGPKYRGAADTWLTFLLQRQMTEDLGWSPSDREYGGWGYAHGPPRKPAAGQTADPAALPNLSATAFGLEALRAVGRPGDDPAFGRAIHFVCNCHNFADDPTGCDPAFDDGGFFFVLGDPPRNKAGVAGTDRRGRERFASYGSTTADGLRALLACGLPRDGCACDGGPSLAHRQLLRGCAPGPLRAGPECVADVGVLLLVLVGGARAGGRRCGRRSVGRAARRGVGAAAAAGRLVGQRRRRSARGRPDRGNGAGGRGAVNLPRGAAVLKIEITRAQWTWVPGARPLRPRGSRRDRPRGRGAPRRIRLECVKKRDRRFGVGQCRDRNSRRHERARSSESLPTSRSALPSIRAIDRQEDEILAHLGRERCSHPLDPLLLRRVVIRTSVAPVRPENHRSRNLVRGSA